MVRSPSCQGEAGADIGVLVDVAFMAASFLIETYPDQAAGRFFDARSAIRVSVSGGQANGSRLKGNEAGQGLDPRQPGLDLRVAREVDIPFRRPGDIAVECDIGEGRRGTGNPGPAGQFLVDH